MAGKLYLLTAVFILMAATATRLQAQSADELLNIMVAKGVISQTEADSMRAEAAIRAQTAKEKQKNFTFNTSRLLQFSGYVQVRFQSNQAKGVPDGFDIRRARLDIRGDLSTTWEYRLQVDFAVLPKVLDAYAIFKPFNFLKFEAGQFKVPLSADNIMASNKMEFIDRSQVTEALAFRSRDVIGNNNGRDIGVMVFGSLFKMDDRFLVDYFMGGFNGQGINTLDRNEAKNFGGRLLIHPLKGLDIGGAYYNGYDYTIIKPDTGNFIRKRYAGEFAYTYNRLSVKAEYIAGQDGRLKRDGFFVQASFLFLNKKLQALAKYDQYEPDKAKGNDIGTWYIAGVNYFFNNWAKIGVNYTYKSEEGGEVNKINNDLISAQLQVGF